MTDTPAPAYSGPSRVLSGVQPTGALHLGNYLGALVKFTQLQHEMETFIFVADLHAITQWQDPKKLKDQVREIAAELYPDRTVEPFPGTAAFVDAAIRASRQGLTVAALLPHVFDSQWVRDRLQLAEEVWVVTRIRFEDFTGKPGPQPPGGHCLLVYRPHVPVAGWPGGPRVDWQWIP